MTSPRATSRTAIPALVLVALVAASYAPAYEAGFVDFDDSDYVVDNHHVRSGLTLTNVVWAFTHEHSSNWHPLTWISHMADVELFGLDARGHHAMNVAIHAACTALLFAMLASLTGRPIESFVVAGVFGLHPVNVESVAWISQRKTTLATLFAILAIWGHARFAVDRDPRWRAASLAAFALSLLSKALFVTLPFALLLLDFWPLRRTELDAGLVRGGRRLLREKAPYLALALAVSAVSLATQQEAMLSVEVYPLAGRIGNAAISYVSYLGLLFWPAHLAAFHPQYADDVTAPKVAASVALLAAISAAVWWRARRDRSVLFGWLWFLGTMIPMIGLVHVGAQSMADRYAYVPFWGLAIALVWTASAAVARLPRRAGQAVAAAGIALLFGALGVRTFEQARTWHDTTALFENAVAHTERNWLAHRSLANQYFGAGDYDRAIEHCEAALRYNRDPGTILATYGLALYEKGEVERAIEKLDEAIRLAPSNPIPRMNLGWIYSDLGKYDVAEAHLAAAASRIDRFTSIYVKRTIHANWGQALSQLRRFAPARAQYERALETAPDSAFLLRDAAAVDLALGDPVRAAERLRAALAIDPRDARTAALLQAALEERAARD